MSKWQIPYPQEVKVAGYIRTQFSLTAPISRDVYKRQVRLGSAILGRMPFQTGLRPVGYVKAQIDTVRVLPKGHTTGYGAIWKRCV